MILFFVRIFVDLLEFDENQTNIIKKDDENPLKRQIESLIESRKLLHFLVNEQELKKTPILLICNVKKKGKLKKRDERKRGRREEG